MRQDLTDLTLVIDRSGSMATIVTDAQGGINQFLDDQKKQPGECLVSLVQFDHAYEFVHKGTPIKNIAPYVLQPRGNTALLDAVGRAITETGERLKAMAEADRPGLVVFVIVTDGQENASREYTLAQVRSAIEHQREVYKWQFVFLSSGLDAFGEAAKMGIGLASTSPVASNAYVPAYAGASANVSRMRTARAGGQSVTNQFTDAERQAMSGDDPGAKP